ncbi:diacylglycerol kinase family protein [Streptomyces physcomitrii]|uniref:diacylglycerol kinase family protein n=1 Tax=Streptomyces physcomitrii TaxID=2724184 RepID=UPI00343D7BAC
MTREIILFVNPTAGRGRGARAARPVADLLRTAGHRVRTVVGKDAAEAVGKARAAVAEGTDALIAVGGDGMAGLALQVVGGTEVPLGLVAVGTGNDLARSLGLPLRDPRAAALELTRVLAVPAAEPLRATPVDLGRVSTGTAGTGGTGPGAEGPEATDPGGAAPGSAGASPGSAAAGPGTWFGTVLASGFDSRVNDRGNRIRLPLGRFKYDLAILAELAAFRPIPYRIRLDGGEVREIEATLVAVGNGPSYGGGMRICAGADMHDGLFQVTVVGEASRTDLLRVFPRVYQGTHLDHPSVTVHRAARVELAAPGVTAYADGDPVGALPLTAECVPGAVRFLGLRAGPVGRSS